MKRVYLFFNESRCNFQDVEQELPIWPSVSRLCGVCRAWRPKESRLKKGLCQVPRFTEFARVHREKRSEAQAQAMDMTLLPLLPRVYFLLRFVPTSSYQDHPGCILMLPNENSPDATSSQALLLASLDALAKWLSGPSSSPDGRRNLLPCRICKPAKATERGWRFLQGTRIFAFSTVLIVLVAGCSLRVECVAQGFTVFTVVQLLS